MLSGVTISLSSNVICYRRIIEKVVLNKRLELVPLLPDMYKCEMTMKNHLLTICA
jgi:hypothetical protein